MALRWAGTGFRLLPKGGREQLINNHLVLSPLLHLQLMRIPLSAFLAGWRRRHCRARGVLGRWYPPQAPGSHLLPPSALRHLREATSGGPSGAVLLDFCDQDFESALSGALSASSSGAAPQPSEDPWGSSSSPPCAAGPQAAPSTAPTPSRQSPLHVAADLGSGNAQALLCLRASLDARDRIGATPLFVALLPQPR